MKRFVQIGMIILVSLLLISCSGRFCPYPLSNFNEDCWQRQLVTNPYCWTKHADRWFFTGEPNSVELENRHAPLSAAISTVIVNVPEFTNVKLRGDFQVQLFGSCDHDTVYLFGPNAGVGAVAVTVRGSTLFVEQKGPSPCVKRVIVRIGVRDLRMLDQMGNGCVEAVQINSDCLNIKSSGRGNIWLAGHQVNLNKVNLCGCGSINVFNVNTCRLDIRSAGWGCVNLIGNVGVRSIMHSGSGDINIIGANSCGLCIEAGGCGKISILGMVNLWKLNARDKIQIYISKNNSNKLCANLCKSARVGICGSAFELNVNTSGCSRFWGKQLCTINAYARASGESHINVTARNKIFASASDYSSIYYYGSPKSLTQFASQYANIIPMALEESSCCVPDCVADLASC